MRSLKKLEQVHRQNMISGNRPTTLLKLHTQDLNPLKASKKKIKIVQSLCKIPPRLRTNQPPIVIQEISKAASRTKSGERLRLC